jgi:hypothetical protein
LRFAIYYADGRVHKGDTCNFDDVRTAPTWDAITVKHEAEAPQGYSLRHGCDFYGWEKVRLSSGKWNGDYRWSGLGDLFGLANYLRANEYEWQKLLIGREIPDDTFREIVTKAKEDGCLCDPGCSHRS